VSVDGSTNDPDHELRDAHDICKGASNICECPNKQSDYKHLSTKDAFANLRGRGRVAFSMIVGHGNAGWINTGSGVSSTIDTDQHMSLDNLPDWKRYASQGCDGEQLVLFGCFVAACDVGAKFLQEMAKRVNKDVVAWPGCPYVSRDGMLCADGKPVTAPRDGSRLKPVDPPDLYDGKRDFEGLVLRSPDGNQSVKAKFIESVNFTPIGHVPQMPKAVPLTPEETLPLLKLIDFAHPVEKPGELLAIRTGQLTITFKSEKGLECRAFYLLGYWLLQDAWFSDTYYHAALGLQKMLGDFSRGAV
jgi:hypothetical protein